MMKIIPLCLLSLALLVFPSQSQAIEKVTPSLQYCVDTLHGDAGGWYLQDDNEIHWGHTWVENNYPYQVGSWNVQNTTTYSGYRRWVEIGYWRYNGTYITGKQFYCDRDYWDTGITEGFNYYDYPSGKDRGGIYN